MPHYPLPLYVHGPPAINHPHQKLHLLQSMDLH